MNGKLKNELERLGLTGSGNHFYGVLYGYETNVSVNNLLLFNVSFFKNPETQNSIQHDLLQIKTNFLNWQWNNYGITIVVSGWTYGTIVKNLETQLKTVYEIFAKNGALGVGYCPVCGNELDFDNTKKCLIDGNTISIDNDCVERINAIISQENEEFDAAPNNYLKGFFGALIGGIAGAVVAIILNLLGFISAISAFVAFFVGILLYKKFGGKPNKMMLVIVTATTFVCMILSILSIYLTICAIGAAELAMEGVEISTFGYFKTIMQDREVAVGFWSDMALTILFTVLGCVFEIIKNARKIKRQKNI